MTLLAERAFRRHYGHVYRYLRRRGRPHGDAEDITQQVFLDAVRDLKVFGGGERQVLSWLYLVAERRLRDELRRASRRVAPAAGGLLDVVSTPTTAYGPSVGRALKAGIASLPDGQQRVVVLKLLRGHSFEEIGRSLGLTETACRMRFFRGLESLRAFLQQEGIAS